MPLYTKGAFLGNSINHSEKIHAIYHSISPAVDSFFPWLLSIVYCRITNTETIKNNKHVHYLYLDMPILIQTYKDLYRHVHLLCLHTVNVCGRQKSK